MANLIKNGEGTILNDWSVTNTTIVGSNFKIVEGQMLQSMILTDVTKSSKYKLSYTCNELRSTASYLLLTVGLGLGQYNTYWFPVQFTGYVEIPFDMNEDAQNIIFEVVGDLTIRDIRLDTYSELSGEDKLALQKVSINGEKWDKVIEFTSATGKLNADMLEGLINTTLNRFANTSGTITQENGEVVFLNGTTAANSTAAMKLSSVGLLIADTKNLDGSWHWDTAVTGAGISASAIVTGVLSAITISGVHITASSMTGGIITGVTMEGNTMYSGDRTTGNYIELTPSGELRAYKNHKRILMFNTGEAGVLYIDNAGESTGITLRSKGVIYGMEGAVISATNSDLILSAGSHYIKIPYGPGGTIEIQGDLYVDGMVYAHGFD